MNNFLIAVREAMVNRGWGQASAEAEIRFDPAYLNELHAKGMHSTDVANKIIRQAENRQLAIN